MSFHDPIRPARRHWNTGPKAIARGAPRRRRTHRPTSLAELRLVVLLGLFLGLAYAGAPGIPEFEPDASPISMTTSFSRCHSGGGTDCVVDGDTFYTGGVKVRIADIDTPETHPPRCAEEARLGEAATLRLQALLSDGPFTLASIDRDEDPYGRKLRVVMRDGASLGDALVAEGLARPYGVGRRPWC